MRKRVCSLVLAFAMMLAVMPQLGGMMTASAADTKIVEFDAKTLFDLFEAQKATGTTNHGTFLQKYGVNVNSTNCFTSGDALHADAKKTLGKEAITCDVRTSKSGDGAAFDFTANTDINPTPAAMESGVYGIDIDFAQLFSAKKAPGKCQYSLRGISTFQTVTFATLEFDSVSEKIYLVDSAGAKQSGELALPMVSTSAAGIGYVRLNVDMDAKTVSAWAAKYNAAGDIGTRPALGSCTALGTISFYDTDVNKMTSMLETVASTGTAPQSHGIYNLKISKLENASLVDRVLTFDKSAASDISTTLVPGGHVLKKLQLDGTDLTVEDDYTVSGNIYTIKTSALSALSTTNHTLTFVMDSGVNPEVSVQVSDSSVSATYTFTAESANESMGSAGAKKQDGSEATGSFNAGDTLVATAMPESGYLFTGWTATGINLTQEQKMESVLTFTMPQQNVAFTANFRALVNPTVTPAAVTFDKDPASADYKNFDFVLAEGDYAFQKVTNGGSELVRDKDYSYNNGTLRVYADYLRNQGGAITTLKVETGAATDPEIAVTVNDSRSRAADVIAEFDADALHGVNGNRINAQSGDSNATVAGRYGIKTQNVWSSSGANQDASTTAGKKAITFGFSSSATKEEAERGGFNLTADNYLNSAPKAMDGTATYLVETHFLTYLYAGSNDSTCYGRYELRGDAGGTSKTIARLKFDRANKKITVVDGSDTPIGESVATPFGQNVCQAGYARFVVDMEHKTYSVYLAKYDSADDVDTMPATLTALVEDQAFLNDDVTKITNLDVSGRFEGGGNASMGFRSVTAKDVTAASVTPASATYDRISGSGALNFTLSAGSFPLSAVKIGTTTLTVDTDYTVSGNVYSIKEETLKALAAGSHTITFDMQSGADPAVALTITSPAPKYAAAANSANDSMGSAAVTTSGTEFEAGAEVVFTATANSGYAFTSWSATGVTLSEEQKTANPVTVTMPAEAVTLTAAFKALTAASLDKTAADFDRNADGANHKAIEVTLTPGDYTFSKLKLGTLELTAGTDYTKNGNVFTIPVSRLAGLGKGGNVFTFEMNGGTNPALTVTVADGAIVRYNAQQLRDLYDAAGGTGNHGTFLKNYGVTVLGNPACYDVEDALHASATKTLNKMAVTYDIRPKTNDLIRSGGIDFTADTAINTAPAPMNAAGVYSIEMDYVQAMLKTEAGSDAAKTQFILMGKKDADPVAIAKIEFDRKTSKVYMLNASGEKTGNEFSLAMSPAVAGYLRADVNMDTKKVDVWITKYASVDEAGTIPTLESGNVLVKGLDLLESDITQLTGLDVYSKSPGTGSQSSGFYDLRVTHLTPASIDKTTADYDLYASAANHKAIEVTLTPGDYTLRAVKNGAAVLTPDTDYTVAGNKYTIKTSYLDTLSTGSAVLTFEMNGGTDPAVTVTVANTTPGPVKYTAAANSANASMGSAAVTTVGTEFEAGAEVVFAATANSGYAFTGWSAAGVTLTEEQKTANPVTVTMPAANVTLTAAFEAKTNASIDKTAVDYDLYTGAADHKAIEVTLTPGGYTFSKLKNDTAELTLDTDYTVAGNKYTIKTSYLDTLNTGSAVLTFEMSGGTNPEIAVTVVDTTPAAKFTAAAASADANMGSAEVTTQGGPFEAGAEVVFTATPAAGYKFKQWNATGASLSAEQQKANPVTVTMPAANVTLTAVFEAKTPPSIDKTTAEYDRNPDGENHRAIRVNLTQGDYTFQGIQNPDGVMLREGTDYLKNGSQFDLQTSYLDKQIVGETVLMFHMDGYGLLELTINVRDTAAEPKYDLTAESTDPAKGNVQIINGEGPFLMGEEILIFAEPEAGNHFTGWNATGLTLSDEEKMMNPLEIVMPAEAVTLTASFAAGEKDASITPSTAVYDRNPDGENHKPITVILDMGSHMAQSMNNGDEPLRPGTDFIVDGAKVIITQDYLDSLQGGSAVLTIVMDGGANPELTITLEDTTPQEYTFTVESADASMGGVEPVQDATPAAGQKVSGQAKPEEGYHFTNWTATGITLTEEQKVMSFLEFEMPEADVTLTANFAEGTEDGTVTPETAVYDRNAAGANHKDISFTVKTGSYFVTGRLLVNGEAVPAEKMTWEGTKATILASYLDTLEGAKAEITVEMDGGVNPVFTVNFEDTTVLTHKVTVSAGTGGNARISGGKTEFKAGETVNVTATAESGYEFAGWSGGVNFRDADAASTSFVMPDKAVSVYASFKKKTTSGGGPRRDENKGSSGGVVVGGGSVGPNNNNNGGGTNPPAIDHLTSNHFGDVSTTETWAYGYIESLASAGIISGDQNKNFNPKNTISREEFLKMLMEALDIDPNAAAGGGFSDVDSNEWYAGYINAAASLGLVSGNGDGTFGVGATITREDMAVLASRALAIKGKTLQQTQEAALTDLNQVSDYAQSSVNQLASAGIISGDENASFRPADTALREEAAKIIYMLWNA